MVRFSIIIPVYNVEKFLKQCLNSVLMQTFYNYEAIIIDDGSTDHSGQIAAEYCKKNEYFTLIVQENQGLGAARNRGMSFAKGEYLMFLDADDYLDFKALEQINQALESRMDAELLMFDAYTISEGGETTGILKGQRAELWSKERDITANSIVCNIPAAWNKVFKRTLLERTKILFPTNIWFEDLAFSEKIFLHAKQNNYLEKPLYFYRWRKDSILNSNNIERNQEIILILEKICRYYKKKGMYKKYSKELEFLAVLHVLLYAGQRVNNKKFEVKLQRKFLNYIKHKFPRYTLNPYLATLSLSERKQLKLILQGNYFRLFFKYMFLYKIKCNLKEWVDHGKTGVYRWMEKCAR